MPRDFEVLPHTADIKIRVFGSTLNELFSNAVVGMFQAVGPHAQGCRAVRGRLVCDQLPQEHTIELHAIDIESLMVDFLSEVLYLSDINNEAYLDVTVHAVEPSHIAATIRGVKITGFDVVEIKAVTYHELSIKKINGDWQAEIVFDI